MEELKGKKILFFAPMFFDYEKEIIKKLTEFGAIVDYYDERPENDFLTKASLRINKEIIKNRIEKYYQQILGKTNSIQYDFVFVVNIEAMTPIILERFKHQQYNATFILYMWDSLQNKKKQRRFCLILIKSFHLIKQILRKFKECLLDLCFILMIMQGWSLTLTVQTQ